MKTKQLIEKWISLAPRRAEEVARILAEAGIKKEVIEKELAVKTTKPKLDVEAISTFSSERQRLLSPMLSARMEFAGTISDGSEKWLDAKEVSRQVLSKKAQKTLANLRNNWENSAPAKFHDDQISIFGISRDNFSDITLLVWEDESPGAEPKLYRYFGQSEAIFENLDAFLEWATT